MFRRPNYDLVDTTIPGLKKALKAADLPTDGNKLDLCERLAQAYEEHGTSLWQDAALAETAYACFYPSARNEL